MHLFTTDTVDVYRLEETGAKEAYGAIPIYEDVDCQIVPASDDIIAIYGGGMTFALHEIFLTASVDLKNGDKLVSADTTYIVRGAPMKVNSRFMNYTRLVGEVVV